MPYALTSHAVARIAARGLGAPPLAAALDGGGVRQRNGHILFRDSRSRCAVVVDPQAQTIVTAYRLTRMQMKRHYSR